MTLTVAGSTATLYVDGGDAVTYSGPAGSTPTYGSGSIVIGNNWAWARNPPQNYTRGFNGKIDEVDLFLGADPDKVQAIFSGTL